MPVAYGVTPGSGPGHLALFGYDPERFTVGRGVLEALGIDFDLQPTRRRRARQLLHGRRQGPDHRPARGPHRRPDRRRRCARSWRRSSCRAWSVFVEPVRDHRFVLVLRGEGLADRVTETDPQREGGSRCPCAPSRRRRRRRRSWSTS